jgi:hypothetical protein
VGVGPVGVAVGVGVGPVGRGVGVGEGVGLDDGFVDVVGVGFAATGLLVLV